MELGEQLKARRVALGMSQKKLAEALKLRVELVALSDE